MGQPGRPALSSGPLLGALAASTSTISLGTLVARIGLLPDEVLVDVLCGIDSISGGRCIAGIGTGDRLSREENQAYGIPFETAGIRRERLGAVAAAVAAAGVPVWVGRRQPGDGRPGPVDRAPRSTCGRSDADRVAALAGQGVEVTWGGPVGRHRPRRPRPRWARWPPPAPPGRCAPGRSRSRWWPRPRPPSGRRRTAGAPSGLSGRPPGCGGNVGHGFPPYQRAAAVRLRHHQRPEGSRPPRRSGRHRHGVRQPGPALARRGRGEAGRGRPQPAQPPLLGQPGHPEDPPGHLPTSTCASSTSSSTPTPRWSPPSAPRRDCPT